MGASEERDEICGFVMKGYGFAEHLCLSVCALCTSYCRISSAQHLCYVSLLPLDIVLMFCSSMDCFALSFY